MLNQLNGTYTEDDIAEAAEASDGMNSLQILACMAYTPPWSDLSQEDFVEAHNRICHLVNAD